MIYPCHVILISEVTNKPYHHTDANSCLSKFRYYETVFKNSNWPDEVHIFSTGLVEITKTHACLAAKRSDGNIQHCNVKLHLGPVKLS